MILKLFNNLGTIDISLSTQVESENSDMSTLDDQGATSLEYSEETTEETILTTETPCKHINENI